MHVEIQRPGGLYCEVTESNFEYVNDYRNPVLADVLKGLGYVDRYGRVSGPIGTRRTTS